MTTIRVDQTYVPCTALGCGQPAIAIFKHHGTDKPRCAGCFKGATAAFRGATVVMLETEAKR